MVQKTVTLTIGVNEALPSKSSFDLFRVIQPILNGKRKSDFDGSVNKIPNALYLVFHVLTVHVVLTLIKILCF